MNIIGHFSRDVKIQDLKIKAAGSLINKAHYERSAANDIKFTLRMMSVFSASTV